MTTTLHLHRDAGARRWSRPWNGRVGVPDAHPTREGDPAGQDDDSSDDDKPPLWRRTLSLLFTVLIIAGAVYLWPARLGGDTRLVIVSGHSMEPTYDLGDIVVARGGGTPEVGDTVVFAVPEGTAEGMLVIHRILELDEEGRFITQGDNRETPDQWPLTEADIVGEPLLHIPKGGVIVRFFQQLWVLAIVLGLLAMFLLWPDGANDQVDAEAGIDDDPPRATKDAGRRRRDERHLDVEPIRTEFDPVDITLPLRRPDLVAGTIEVGVEVLAVGRWSTTSIDEVAMAEAEAWLDEQLSAALPETAGV